MIRFLGLLWVLGAPAFASSGPMEALEDHPDKVKEALLLDRCEDFVLAVSTYAQILTSNPVHGKDPSRGAPFEWTNNVRNGVQRKRLTIVRQYEETVSAYMDAFGPVTHPTVVPNLALYQSDKKTCLTHFGNQDEQKE